MPTIYNNSLYGNYRQVKFTDIWSDVDSFVSEYISNGIPQTIRETSIKTLYYMLYARYGNSVIASSDTNQFKYKLWTIVFSYGPTWEKRLDIQEKLRGITENDLEVGNTTIFNHSYNPSTAPSTDTLSELPTINEQTAQKLKRSKMDAYAFLWDLLDTDVTTEFINKFAVLFLKIVEPELPLWYITKLNNGGNNNG